MTYYQPQDILVEYYNEVRPFGKEDKKLAEQKIGDALHDLIDTEREKEEFIEKLNKLFLTQGVANTNIH